VNSPIENFFDPCLLYLKEIKQNKCSNSSSRLAREEKNDGNKNEKKLEIHLDTQLYQLVINLTNLMVVMMTMTRYQGSYSI
jgi:hypothetical protein